MIEPFDTIVAKASGAGKAGVAVFRLSGTSAFAAAARLCGGGLPQPRRASLRKIVDKVSLLIDEGLVVLFPAPASFTGEDVAEFHLHGGRAVEAAFLSAAVEAGARPARPGEFTRRALLNGRLDLAQVEALSDLLDAETTHQRMQALGQLGGRLSAAAVGWKKRLVSVLAPLEAEIDFPNEEGVPAAVAARALPAIDELLAELRAAAADAIRARRIREGVAVAIIGPPNAGKSSLLNRLSGSEVAIVSERPGTTRDVLAVRLDLDGVAVELADTAGLRETAGDEIEEEGMRRAIRRAEDADLRILVLDAAHRNAEDDLFQGQALKALLKPGDFVIFNKSDLGGSAIAAGPFAKSLAGSFFAGWSSGPAGRVLAPPSDQGTEPEGGASREAMQACHTVLALSAKTGAGLDQFVRLLSEAVQDRCSPTDDPSLTRLRHADAVNRAIAALERARLAIPAAPELAAEDARLAARALGEITGEIGAEDILDAIFASFCIGK